MKDRFSAFALFVALFLALAGSLGATNSHATLPPGAAAPDFTTMAAVGGAAFDFSLASALRKGPVVLYFYPKAFASECTIEAHAFAEASAQFKALGATVVGVSGDSMETLKLFSTTECRRKFAVAADAGARVMRKYDVVRDPVAGVAERVSYVISPRGRVLHVYAGLDADGHVQESLAALKQWKRRAASAVAAAKTR
jgi:peroxiredoxin Q/BCP